MKTTKEESYGSEYKEPGWLKEYWVEILVLIAGLAVIHLAFITKAFDGPFALEAGKAGQFGDFVGGYIGTFLALASVVLLTATARNQRKSTQILNFEAKYFELLRLHRDNVAELEVQGITGRKLFVVLIREYRSALDIVRQVASVRNLTLTSEEALHIAYYCLFYGTGANSTRMLQLSLGEFDSNFVMELTLELDKSTVKSAAQRAKNLAYVPFEGHQSRLGHYYRHLYQAIRYVDEQKIPVNKYQYVKTIRAQLSNHEQALLLLNSLTPLGKAWWKKKYILKYRLLQNIPREFFNSESEINLSNHFPVGYFEWEENLQISSLESNAYETHQRVIDFSEQKSEGDWQITVDNFYLKAIPKIYEWFQWIFTLAALTYVERKANSTSLSLVLRATYILTFAYFLAYFHQFHFKGFAFTNRPKISLLFSLLCSAVLTYLTWLFVIDSIDAVVKSQSTLQ